MAHFDPFRPPNQPIKGFDPYDRTPKWPVLTPFRPHLDVDKLDLVIRTPFGTPKLVHLDPKSANWDLRSG